METVVVAGIGTEVGKTVCSAIVAQALQATYWKPVQIEKPFDRETVQRWLPELPCLPEAHVAPSVEATDLPALARPPGRLVIEPCGGLLVPLGQRVLCRELLAWDPEWIVVSRHYLGSINHTLLTLQVLKQWGARVRGILFNGLPHPKEAAILQQSGVPCLGRLHPEPKIDRSVITWYARQWNKTLSASGTHFAKPPSTPSPSSSRKGGERG